jgi:hypothetical protein
MVVSLEVCSSTLNTLSKFQLVLQHELLARHSVLVEWSSNAISSVLLRQHQPRITRDPLSTEGLLRMVVGIEMHRYWHSWDHKKRQKGKADQTCSNDAVTI